MAELGAIVYAEVDDDQISGRGSELPWQETPDQHNHPINTAESQTESSKESEKITNEKPIPLWRKILGDGHVETQKTLKPRHISFLALGGAIGTGVFFSIGATVAQAGPGGALVIYGITGVFVLSVVACLAEMTSYLPHSGAFQHYADRFVSPAFVSFPFCAIDNIRD